MFREINFALIEAAYTFWAAGIALLVMSAVALRRAFATPGSRLTLLPYTVPLALWALWIEMDLIYPSFPPVQYLQYRAEAGILALAIILAWLLALSATAGMQRYRLQEWRLQLFAACAIVAAPLADFSLVLVVSATRN